ncbi:hypothetical protein DERP_004260 [Dermatophagoides pteronyssinus]|uniref:Uncharacterized protein n=1 Tax=Dermatophagoides pteronyssinus TaxID=6956 RepID=A0ABQ8J969_DERPT|nr:hypothetical protein DERP_004260 [Dermatophagoides pteronyssinus]
MAVVNANKNKPNQVVPIPPFELIRIFAVSGNVSLSFLIHVINGIGRPIARHDQNKLINNGKQHGNRQSSEVK